MHMLLPARPSFPLPKTYRGDPRQNMGQGAVTQGRSKSVLGGRVCPEVGGAGGDDADEGGGQAAEEAFEAC
jgi:hypothetical protein